MKRLIPISLISILILLAFSVVPAAAKIPTPIPTLGIGLQPTPTPTLQQLAQGKDVYSFSNLGKNDQVMNGPYDSVRVRFSVPSDWKLVDGAAIQLHLNNSFLSSSNISQAELIKATGATLDVEFNGIWQTTLVLNWVGEKTITIPINDRSKSESVNGQHYIGLYLNAAVDCNIDHQTTVVVMSDSNLTLTHEIVVPQVDLTQFPSPIFQLNEYFAGTVVSPALLNTTTTNLYMPTTIIVTQDKPDLAEMKSALIVSAGLGRITNGNLPIFTIPISQLTDEIMKTSHLIFVGKGTGFNVLKNVMLPAAFDGLSFKNPNSAPDDGMIQEVVSPWDTSKVIVVVSGDSDSGILKAAQAISTGVIMPVDRKDLALVSKVNPGGVTTTVTDDRTLADLKYPTVVLDGNGVQSYRYLFYIPPGQMLRSNAYFKLTFTNSPFLDIEQSAISVLLNDQAIGGARYTAESTKSIISEQINIQGSVLRDGMNQLVIEADHRPIDACSGNLTTNLWTSISDQSLLHIPLTPVTVGIVKQTTLANFRDFLSTSPTLDSTAFIVAENSSEAIKAASQIAYQLGAKMTGELVELNAAYAGSVPQEFKKDHDLVIIGRASQLPIISELGSNLPAQFDKGSDVAQETVFRVIYRIPPEISVGYLELLATPWDSTRNILAVLGSTEEGLSFSSNALTIPALQNKLAGNFAVVRNQQILTGDTRLGTGTGNISSTLVPDAPVLTQVLTDVPTFVPDEPIPFENRTNWIIPFVSITSLLIVLIIAAVAIVSRRRKM